MTFLNLSLPITPKGALDDYRWLRANHYWWHFSLREFTASHWQPMTERELIDQLSTRVRFNRGSRPYRLAHELRTIRQYHESKDGGKSLREASQPSEGPSREVTEVRMVQQEVAALLQRLQRLNAEVQATVELQEVVSDMWELNRRMINHWKL